MTNAELLAKIKTEIEKLMDEYKPIVGGIDETTGAHIALAKLHSFLSTLESEKPMNLEEEISRTYHDGSVADTSDLDHNCYENIARHFYELGCRRTAEKYDEIEYNRQRAEESPLPEDTVLFNKGVEEGKRLMMEGAVEGEVVKDINNKLAVTAKNVNLDKFKFGDKVRVIVLPKEDKK